MLKKALFLVIASAMLAAGCSRTAASYYADGNKYYESRQYKEAVVQLRNAVAKDSHMADAHERLADSYMVLNDPGNALREYVLAADLKPNDALFQVKAGKLLLVAGKFEDAQARAQKAFAIDAKNVSAQILLGNAQAGLKDIDAGIATIEAAVSEAPPGDTSVYSSLAVLTYAKGDTKKAEALLKKAVENNPKSAEAQLALANLFWALRRLPETEEAMNAALAISPNDVLVNRALASFYASTGRPDKVEAPLKIVVQQSDPAARMVLADYYISRQRVDDAKAILVGLSSMAETKIPAKLRLATIAFDEKRPEEGHKLLAEVKAADPKNAPALLVESRLYTLEGNAAAALASAQAAAAADSRFIPAHLTVAKMYMDKNDLDQAAVEYSAVLEVAPASVEAKTQLGNIALVKGDAAKAASYANELLAQSPAPQARLLLIRALLAERQLDRAAVELTSLSHDYRSSPVINVEIGKLAALRGDTAGASRAFDAALKSDPHDREAFIGMVGTEVDGHKIDAARTRVEAEMARLPNDPALPVLLAQVHLSHGDVKSAEQVLKTAVLGPNATAAEYGLLGRVYASTDKLDEAMAEFQHVADTDPKSVGAQTALGVLLQVQNKPDQARQHYEHALELNPADAVSANNLAWLYAEKGEKLDIALQLAQGAKAKVPASFEIDDTLGYVYLKKGLAGLALSSFQQAVKGAPKNPEFHYHLGLAYAQNGQKAEARASLEQALRLKANFAGADDARKVLKTIQG